MPPNKDGEPVIEDKEQKGPPTDAELEGLSPEERAALEDGDDENVDGLKAIAGEDDDEDAEAKAAEAKAAADEKAAAEAKAARDAELAAMSDDDRKKAVEEDERKAAEAKAAADAAAEEERKAAAAAAAEDDDDEPFVPSLKVAPPEKYEERMAELDERRDQATKDYQDNKIPLDEMLKAHREVDGEQRKLDAQKVQSDISTTFTEQSQAQLWGREVKRFISHVGKAEGIDYNKPVLNAALDAEVKRLANLPENAEKPARWFLDEAHKNVKEGTGITSRAPVDKGEKERREKEAAAARKAKEAKDRAGASKSLAHVPPAAGEDAGSGGEFAHLDGLDGMELENAVAKMSSEAQDRWART
jgi:hypothetical protein